MKHYNHPNKLKKTEIFDIKNPNSNTETVNLLRKNRNRKKFRLPSLMGNCITCAFKSCEGYGILIVRWQGYWSAFANLLDVGHNDQSFLFRSISHWPIPLGSLSIRIHFIYLALEVIIYLIGIRIAVARVSSI